MLSETIDVHVGLIRASGHLTAQGADLLRGTADSLREGGHRRVVVDLAGVEAADDDGLAELQKLRSRFAADGDELVLRHTDRLIPAV
jgi:anti-anti-sigma regulatory factor